MKIGLIARGDARGIGYQTREFLRHMPVERVLVVSLENAVFPTDMSLFPSDAVQVTYSQKQGKFLGKKQVLIDWLNGLDVVFAVETVYDWNLIPLARSCGTKVVIQGNPEFYQHRAHPARPHPDEWWWPTDWLIDDLPGVVMPVPVPDDAPFLARNADEGPLVVSFVIGHAAWRDRAGAIVVGNMFRRLDQDVLMRIYCQDPDLPMAVPPQANVHVTAGGVEDRWSMYAGAHLLLAPRRYGGLSLPTNEAMAAGLAVAMTDCSPNHHWPIIPLPAQKGQPIRCQGGFVPHYQVNALEMADLLNALAKDRDRVAAAQRAAQEWAAENTWAVWAPRYLDRLENL